LPEPSAQAVVLDTDVASRSFKGLLPPRLAAQMAGRQPLLTFVTVGELTQWTKLRRWGPRNRGMLEAWLADKPVIPGARSIAMTWTSAGRQIGSGSNRDGGSDFTLPRPNTVRANADNQYWPYRSLHGAAPLKPLSEPVDLEQYRGRRQTRAGSTINEHRLVA